MQTPPGFGCGDGGSTGCLVDWLECERKKDTRVVSCHSRKSRIVTRYRSGDFQEPGARLRPWLRELSFWRHDHQYSCEQTRCQTVQGIAPRNDWSEFGKINFFGGSNPVRVKGFDLVIGAIRHHFRSFLEAEPEEEAEIALYQSTRSQKGNFCGIHVAESATNFARWRVVFKELLPTKLKGSSSPSDRPS